MERRRCWRRCGTRQGIRNGWRITASDHCRVRENFPGSAQHGLLTRSTRRRANGLRTEAASDQESRPKALFLTPEAPYPLAGGGALRSASLLEYLAQTHQVDVITFRQPGAEDPVRPFPARCVRRVAVIDLPEHGRGLAARGLRNAIRVARRVSPLVDRFSGFE